MSTQRFVIDININGTGGQGTNQNAGLFPGLYGGADKGKGMAFGFENPDMPSKLKSGKFGKDYYTAPATKDAVLYANSMKLKNLSTRAIDLTWVNENQQVQGGVDLVETAFGEYTRQNSARFKALGAAAIRQTAAAIIDYRQHTSGDAYANAQLSNGLKLVSYGAMIAGSGPAAPFVAVGIAVTEVVGGISEVAKYNYDRKLERQQISNMQAVAGNTSYGRNRGSV